MCNLYRILHVCLILHSVIYQRNFLGGQQIHFGRLCGVFVLLLVDTVTEPSVKSPPPPRLNPIYTLTLLIAGEFIIAKGLFGSCQMYQNG